MKILQGNGVSPGVAMGHVLKPEEGLPPIYRIHLTGKALDREVQHFEKALQETTLQLKHIQDVLEKELGREHSLMIEAHVMILQDSQYSGSIREIIRSEQVNADWAVHLVTEKIQNIYAKMDDPYLREKIHDIRDISARLLRNLSGRKTPSSHAGYESIIMVSPEINLSLLNENTLKQLKGFAVDLGGWTSHISILSRSLKIPSVIHLKTITNMVHTGQFVIIDGYTGVVYLDPDKETIARYKKQLQSKAEAAGPYSKLNLQSDGKEGMIPGVKVYMNTEFPFELEDYSECQVDGVGLYRSEYLCLGRPIEAITTEEHEEAYRNVARKVFPHTANIRTFDLGADKLAETGEQAKEANPAMGMRGIRLSIQLDKPFRRQLTGILKAAEGGNLRLTLPFISSVDEVKKVKAIINEIHHNLGNENPPQVPIGAMLEIPSTFFIVGSLAAEVDFFTLGTNDLLQFTLAMDRNNAEATWEFCSAHPAMRKGLEMIHHDASARKKEVLCCGEMASHPFYLLILLAMGFRSVSVNRPCLPLVRYIIRHVEPGPLERFYKALSGMNTLGEIENFFKTRLGEFFPETFVNTLLYAYRCGLS